VRTHPFDGLWLDIGRPEDYEDAVRTFEANRSEFLE
jgi:NDP-sugar pyrophosphorylase family protein